MLKKDKIKIIKALLFSAVLYFIIHNFWVNISQIREYDFEINWTYFIPALILWLFTNLYPVWAWQKLITYLGGKLPLNEASYIWFTSNLSRYIPGGIWVFAGLVYLANKAGVSKKVSFQAMIYSQATANLLGISFILILFKEYFNPFLLYGALGVGALFLIPKIFNYTINFGLKLVKKSPLEKRLKGVELLTYFALQLINWLSIGTTFYLFINSFTPISLVENPQILILLPACWTAAFLSLIAPGGIGIRESLLTLALTPIIGAAPAFILPWLHRLIQTIIEVILALFFVMTNKVKKDR